MLFVYYAEIRSVIIGKKGVFRLIGIAAFLAQQFHSQTGYDLDITLPQMIRFIRVICGNKALFREFVQHLENNSTLMPTYAPLILKRDLEKFGELLRQIPLMTEITHNQYLLRPVDILVQGLFMTLGPVKSQTVRDNMELALFKPILIFKMNVFLLCKIVLHLDLLR